VFLGYRLQPGGKWRGECYTMALDDANSAHDFLSRGAYVHRVKEVIVPDGPFIFPLKQAFEKARCVVADFNAQPKTAVVTDMSVEPEGQAAFLPPADPSDVVHTKPFLEFCGNRIYGFGHTNDTEAYPTEGVFYVPGGQIINGRFVRKQTPSNRPLALSRARGRGIWLSSRESYTALWQELMAQ